MSTSAPWSDRLRLALLRIDRTAAVGITALVVVGLVAAVAFAVQGRPSGITYSGDGSAVAVSAASGATTAPEAGPSAAVAPGGAPPGQPGAGGASGSTVVVVDVVGRVRRPGLVSVPVGARVFDVVQAAGGFRRASDAPSVNLARVVSDGEQVVVGPPPKGLGVAPVPGGGSGGASGGTANAEPVDLNSATLEALETLPGVGPVLAQRILDHRTTNGSFRSVDELRDVSGIGDKTFADLAPRVRV